MRKNIRHRAVGAALALLVTFLLASPALAGTGSNQGDYGTNFAPAVLTGQVSSGGSPVSGASVYTIAGHMTTTDGSGNYTLYLDASGIYTVSAESGTDSATDTVEVSLGVTSNLDLALAAAPSPTPTPTATPTPTPTAIPGVSGYGLAAMAGLLLFVFLWAIRRRQRRGTSG